jgi:type II secretory pathway pseudopilin PulG
MRNGRRPSQRGYTYLLVLFMVAGLGLFVAQAGVVWQLAGQRDREAELLAIGIEFAQAIARYTEETPTGTAVWPTELSQLVEDRRFANPRRHLRRVYRDPFTGRPEWGVVREGEAIIGIHSLSTQTPLRRANLPAELGAEAEHAVHYSEWVFRARSGEPL